MAKRKFSLSDVIGVIGAGREADRQRQEEVNLLVAVGHDVPRDICCDFRDALMPQSARASVRVCKSSDADEALLAQCDACIVIAGDDLQTCEDLAQDSARRGVPVAVIVESQLDIPQADYPEPVAALLCHIPAATADVALERVASFLLDQLPEKACALAANFPFCRKEQVRRLARTYAMQNAAVGAVDLIHGADLPIMSVNQTRMAIDIAASYGQALEIARLFDVGAILASGLAWRHVTRKLVPVMPHLAPVLRASVGYAGTLVASRVVIGHLELGNEGLAQLLSGLGATFSQFFKAFGPKPKKSEEPTKAHSLIPAEPKSQNSYITL